MAWRQCVRHACLFLTCLFLLCKCETVLGKENFIYKYECRGDKLSVSAHSGKRHFTFQVKIMLDSRRKLVDTLNR